MTERTISIDEARRRAASEPDRQNDRPAGFTDDALASCFTEAHGDDLRYVAAWGRWLEWTGQRWRFDDTYRVFDLARIVCRDAAQCCNNKKDAHQIASAKTVAAVEKLARADRQHAATVDLFDTDPFIFNEQEPGS